MPHEPAIVLFTAPSGTGKTTLIERVIPELRARGIRVGAVKSDAHRLELDARGKDSWRLREAGADATLLVGRDQLALFGPREPAPPEPQTDLRERVRELMGDMDLVLVEGFRRSREPAIVLRRSDGPPRTGWTPPERPIAIASDAPVAPVDCRLPVLDLNRPEEVADFLCRTFSLCEARRAS